MIYSVKHLQYLVAVADEKSFSKAAQSCFVTQSTLSLGIQELERQMDLKLFERGRKTILPTAGGRIAIAHAREILRQNSALDADIAAFNNPNAGPLRIGVIPTIAPYFLPQILPTIEEHFPESHLRIAEDPTDVIIRKITNGDMDLAILALPVDIQDLESKILLTEDFVLAHHNTLSLPSQVSLDHLKDMDVLLLREGHCLKDHILSGCQLPPEKQNRFFEAESLHTLLAMVNQGYGVTLIPAMAIDAGIIKSFPNVRVTSFSTPIPTRHIALVWRKTDIRAASFRMIS